MGRDASEQNETVIFKVKADGLFARLEGGEMTRVSDRIKVVGFAVEEGGKDYVAVVRFRDRDGEEQQLLTAVAELQRPAAVLERLANRLFELPEEKYRRKLLAEYLRTANPKRRYVIASRTGWFAGRYVRRDSIVGDGDAPIIYEPVLSRRGHLPSRRGNLNGWIDGVAVPAANSSLILFAISASLASTLIGFVEVESGGFHFWGKSSKGKTVAGIATESVHDNASRVNLLHWDVTDTGLAELAVEHCDRSLLLDEIGRLEPHYGKLVSVSYMLASGSGRVRSLYFGKNGNPTNWRLFYFSTGEKPISALLKSVGHRRLEGEIVRLIDIPARLHQHRGVFDRAEEGTDTRKLAENLESACAEHFGHAGPEFVLRFLASEAESLDLVRKWLVRFEQLAGVPGHAWERRFARRFALAYAAARLARRFGIVPWSMELIEDAIVLIYRLARADVPDQRTLVRQAVAALGKGLTQSDRILDLREHAKHGPAAIKKAIAFLLASDRHGEYLVVKKSQFRELVGNRVGLGEMLTYLDSKGWLIRDKARTSFAKQVIVPGIAEKRSYYCIRREFFDT